MSSCLSNKGRVDLPDLRAFEHDLAAVRRSELLLDRVPFEVDGFEIRMRRGSQGRDRPEEVVIRLRGAAEKLVNYGAGRSPQTRSSYPELFQLSEGCELLGVRLGDLVVPDVECRELLLRGARRGKEGAISSSATKLASGGTDQVSQAFDPGQAVVREV